MKFVTKKPGSPFRMSLSPAAGGAPQQFFAGAHYSEEEFYRVADFCHELLNRPDAHESWLASPFFHVVSGHPVHFARYALLLSGAHNPNAGLRQGAVTFLRRQRRLARALVTRGLPDFGPREVVLVGGLVNAAHLNDDADFYFGNIQAGLRKRGVTSLLLLRNQTGLPAADLARRAARFGPAARALLPDVGTLSEELNFRAVARNGAKELNERSTAPEDRLGRLVIDAAARDVTSPSTIANLALEDQVRRVCDASRPRLVIGLYEGHAWERCVWRGARRARRDVLCAGYQHTIVRKHTYAVRKKMGAGANPDVLLCLGDITRDELAAEPELAGTTFDVLGTHRRQPSGADASSPSREQACLVLPEGILDEAAHLFTVAAEAARLQPERQFLFRSHPILPFDRVARAFPQLQVLPPNVKVSTEPSLAKDLRSCGWLLYRGSSTALYGILLGVRPAYLKVPHELSIDPLDALDGDWKLIVSDAHDLLSAFSKDSLLSDVERESQWRRAYAFCDRYTKVESERAIGRIAAPDAYRGHQSFDSK